MQLIGFACDFVLFTVPAFAFHHYTHGGIHSFQAMYFLSSFFNQFGPNSVTFLTAAEVYPTPIRATAHGLSAACGKLGALVAALLNVYLTQRGVFKTIPWFGLAGAVLTFLFLPDTTGLDLKEQERRWKFIREGRENEYHGIAIHPKHLSLYERLILRKNKQYNPKLDYQQKVEEIREEWLERERSKAAEKERNEADSIDWENDDWNQDLDNYFQRTTPALGDIEKPPVNGE